MSDPKSPLTAVADAALLQAIQQFNQPRIIGKLLHDLRNPVHSLRIAVEVFSRIATPGADAAKLLQKSARYAAPAEGAVATLSNQIDRFSRYLSPPLAPAIGPLAINAWLGEIAALLRESRNKIESSIESDAGDAAGLADAPRLSHVVLHWALTRSQSCAFHVTVDGAVVRVRVRGAPAAAPEAGAASDADLQRLVAQAGGEWEVNEGVLTVVLKRA